MKLEVGMYVRTYDGRISKVTLIKRDIELNLKFYCFEENIINVNYEECELKKIISKASNNLIDLIEVGDYVNGSEVVDFENKYIEENDKFIPFGVITENCYLENTIGSWIIEKDIKSIVTKEQFESMSYKVEE